MTTTDDHDIFDFLLVNAFNDAREIRSAKKIVTHHDFVLLFFHFREPFKELRMQILLSPMRKNYSFGSEAEFRFGQFGHCEFASATSPYAILTLNLAFGPRGTDR